MGSDKLGRSKDGSKVKYSAGGRVGGVGPGAGGGGVGAGGVPGVVPGCVGVEVGVEAGVDPGLVVEFGLEPGVVDAGDKPPLMLCELEALPAKVEAPGKCPFAEW